MSSDIARHIFEEKAVTLSDMHRFFASEFFRASATLTQIVLAHEGEPDNANIAPEPHRLLLNLLKAEIDFYTASLLPISAQYAADAASEMKRRSPASDYPIRWKDVRKIANGLRERIEEELRFELYVHVDNGIYKDFRKRAPFGSDFYNSWPDLRSDAQEANKCLVMRRYTATVFHSMRILERMVQLLAHYYNITPPKGEASVEGARWNDLLIAIENKLGKHKVSTANPTDDRIREICFSLDSIRGIWRNPVAHPRHEYTKKQARAVFEMSRHVAQQIASLISKAPETN